MKKIAILDFDKTLAITSQKIKIVKNKNGYYLDLAEFLKDIDSYKLNYDLINEIKLKNYDKIYVNTSRQAPDEIIKVLRDAGLEVEKIYGNFEFKKQVNVLEFQGTTSKMLNLVKIIVDNNPYNNTSYDVYDDDTSFLYIASNIKSVYKSLKINFIPVFFN